MDRFKCSMGTESGEWRKKQLWPCCSVVGALSRNQKFVDPVLCRGTCLGCRFGLVSGHARDSLSMFLFLSLPLSPKPINILLQDCKQKFFEQHESVPGRGFKKRKKKRKEHDTDCAGEIVPRSHVACLCPERRYMTITLCSTQGQWGEVYPLPVTVLYTTLLTDTRSKSALACHLRQVSHLWPTYSVIKWIWIK